MFFFYATGITPAMTEKMVGRGSQYTAAFVDAKGSPLDGSKTYRLHMPPNIPAKDFWSITVYDTQTRSMLQTDQRLPAVGSLGKGSLVNADGLVDVYIGPKAPAGKESNWVQALPGKGWNTRLRFYGPLEPWFDKTWRPGSSSRCSQMMSGSDLVDGTRRDLAHRRTGSTALDRRCPHDFRLAPESDQTSAPQ